MTVGAGPIGGASSDAGTEYGRAVGAYAVAFGLAGEPLIEFGPSGTDAHVASVAYQTDDAIDDVRITFTTGHRCYIQAKRTLGFDDQFRSAVAQWVSAAKAGLGPDQHVAVVSGLLSGPIRILAEVLDMLRAPEYGALTQQQLHELKRLDCLLETLSPQQRSEVLRAAHIVHLDVEEPTGPHAAAARARLSSVVEEGESSNAWTHLLAAAGAASRLRQGYNLDGWLAKLSPNVPLRSGDGSALVRRHRVRARYLAQIRSLGHAVDLRELGAKLPRARLSDLDADIKVAVGPADSRSVELLLWAFLRRGRLVLTGLPGGGKSTALARLAADLSDLGDTIPVFVRLRDLVSEQGSFGDRLLNYACGLVGPSDADDLRALLAAALAEGDVTLLLDGLDETHQRRHQIVSDLEQFLHSVSPDVDVILATRDVAYADAATLGWPDLRLLPPANLDHLVEGVLQVTATDLAIPARQVDDWLRTRREWVQASLESEPSLCETPLLPTLLALLASERDVGALPTGRAIVMWEMVEATVLRSERDHGPNHRVGDLGGMAASKALLGSFEAEATLMLASGGPVSKSDLVAAVRDQLGPDWGLPSGQALVAAEEAIRFWDETGVFTLSGAEELATPRIALFSEVGAAQRAVRGDNESIGAWVAATVEQEGFECLVLAAGLSPVAADALIDCATDFEREGDRHIVLMTAVRAVRTGAAPSKAARSRMREALLTDASQGDCQGWQSLTSVVDLLEVDEFELLVDTAAVFPVEHRRVVRTLFALNHPTAVLSESRSGILLAALEQRSLPDLPARSAREVHQDIANFSADSALVRGLTGAARELAESDPAPVLSMLKNGGLPMRAWSEISHLMTEHGHAADVREIHREHNDRLRASLERFPNAGKDLHLNLLEGLTDTDPVALSRQQRRRLSELADLLETLNLNDASSMLNRGIHGGHGLELAALVMRLADLDMGVISAQALVVRERVSAFDDAHAPYFSLFDLARVLPLTHWDDVDELDAAMALSRELLREGLGSAQVAVRIHRDAPRLETTVLALRDVIRGLEENNPRHLMLAAYCLMAQDGLDPAWRTSQNPMLRRIVARVVSPLIDGALNPLLREFLDDPDGTARVEAVRNVVRSDIPGRDELLEAVAAAGNPEFTCVYCVRTTPANTQFCECRFGGAQPATEAAAALDDSRAAGAG